MATDPQIPAPADSIFTATQHVLIHEWQRLLTWDLKSALVVIFAAVAALRFSDWRRKVLDSEARTSRWLHPSAGFVVFMTVVAAIGIWTFHQAVLGLNFGTVGLLLTGYIVFAWCLDRHRFVHRSEGIARGWEQTKSFISDLAPPRALRWDPPSIVFVTVIVLAVLVFMQSRHLIPTSGGSIKLEPVGGSGIELHYETAKGQAESVAVISVPAYRMATPTGITVKGGETIEIAISGIIATSLAYPWFDGPPSPKPTTVQGVYDALKAEMHQSEFNAKTNPDWRDPDGHRLYLNDKDVDINEPYHKAHNEFKLLPDGDYGLLVGCVIPDLGRNPNNRDVIESVLKERDENHLFRIGKNKVIQCLREEGNLMTLHFPSTDHDSTVTPDIHVAGSEGQLVLLVNDIIVSRRALRKLEQAAPPEMKDDLKLTRDIVFKGKVSKQLSADALDTFATEVWYWDNSGIFTAVIKKPAVE